MARHATFSVLVVGSMLAAGAFTAFAVPLARGDALTEPDVDRFVATWSARFDDDAWMEAYFNSTEIVDDGFNDRTEDEKRLLVDVLLARYSAGNGELFEMIHPADGNETTFAEREKLASEMFYGIVFDKIAFVEKIRGPIEKPAVEEIQEGNKESEYFPGMSLPEITAELEGQNAERMQLTDVQALAAPLDLTASGEVEAAPGVTPLDAIPSRAPITLPEALEAAGFEAPEVAEIEMPLVPLAELTPGLEVPKVLPPEIVSVLPPEVQGVAAELENAAGDVLALLDVVLASVTYTVCWQMAGAPQASCTSVPMPLNAPTPVDVNGDNVPDVIVTVTAPVDPTALPDPSVAVSVDRADATATADLPLLVFAVYKLPGATDLYAIAGFDGREDTIPRSTTVTASVSDVLTANPGVHLRLATGGAGDASTLVGGLVRGREAAGGGIELFDPLLAELRLSPVPPVLSVDFTQAEATRFVGTTLERGTAMTLDLASTLATEATATLYQEWEGAPTRAHVLQAVLADLPTDLSLEITSFPSETEIAYDAASVIQSMEAISAAVPDVSDFGTYTLEALAIVEGLPEQIRVTAGGGDVAYEASSVLPLAAFATGEVESGVLASLTYAEATGVPQEITVTTDGGQADIVASAPIGSVFFLAFEGPAGPLSLAGDHFLTVARGASTATSARISGLKEAHVDVAGDTVKASVKLVGGQPFTYYGEDTNAAGFGTYTVGLVSNLPSEIGVEISASSLAYTASQSISQVTLLALTEEPTETTTVIGAVQGVPRSFSLAFSAADGEVVYSASDRIPRLEAYLQRDASGVEETFYARVEDIPASIRLGYDMAAQTFSFQTDSRLGRIVAQMTRDTGSSFEFALVDVRDLPTTIVAHWTNDGTVDFTTDSQVGQITLAASNFPGYYSLAGDGVRVYSRNGVESVYARVTGLAGIHVSAKKQIFNLELASPRPFTALAQVDDSTALVQLNNLPASVTVAFNGDNVMYRASHSIGEAIAYYDDADQVAYARLLGVPREVVLGMGVNPTITTDSALGRLEFSYARGMNPVGLSGVDNVAIVQTPSGAFSVSGRVSSFRSFTSGYSGRHVSVDFSTNQPFVAYVDTPSVFAYATMTNVPGHITIDAQPGTMTYSATNAISRVTAYVRTSTLEAYAAISPVPALVTATWTSNSVTVHTEQPIRTVDVAAATGGNVVSVAIRDIPSTMRVIWSVNAGSGSVTYDADGILGSVTVQASQGSRGAFLQVTGIPKHWQASWGDKSASLTTSSPIGSIWVMATTDGSYSYYGGDHALYVNDASRTRASFKISGLSGFSFSASGSTTYVNVYLAGGQYMDFYLLDERSGNRRMFVGGWLGPLPAATSLALGPTTTFSTSSNMDVQLYFEAGDTWTLSGVPGPYYTHGLVARGNSDLSAIKATVFLTGLPTYVYLNPQGNRYLVQGFAPRYSYIYADLVKPGLDAQVYLGSPARNYDVSFGQGDKSMWVSMYASANMGQLWASVKLPSHAGYVQFSNIPRDVYFSYSAPSGASTNAYYSANIPISSIFVGYHRPWVGFYQAYASLGDVPSYMSISIGKLANGPGITYNANSNALDITVYVDPSLFTGALTARLYGQITNLGSYTRLYQSSPWYVLYSSPRTSMIYLDASATYSYSYSNSDSYGSWWLSLSWHAYISAYVVLDHLYIYVEGLREIDVRPQIPALNFGWFDADYMSMGWDNIYVDLGIDVGVSIKLLGWTFFSAHIHWNPRVYVWVYFDTWAAHRYNVASICAFGYCAYFDAYPHPHYRFYNSFALWGSEDGYNRQRWVFINPWNVIPWAAEWAYMTFTKGGWWAGVR